MPNISEIIGLTSAASGSGLAVTDNELIKGAFQVFSTLARLQAAPTARLTNGQIVWVEGDSKLYQLTITPANPPITFVDTYTWNEFTGFGGSVPSGTISGSAQIAALGYILSSQTSSFVLSSQTSSFALKSEVSGAFTATSSSISTRLTSLEAGGGSVPAGTISGSQQITDLGFINQSQTSSMSVATASYVDPTFISASAAAAGFGSGGGTTTDISALNAFTSSIQTEVNNLTAETSSYALKTQISGAFTQDSASISTRLTSLEAGGGSVPAGTISGSQQITDLGFINQSQTSSMSVLSAETASFISDTFISASAVRSGFGTVTLPSGVVSSSTQTIAHLQGTGILSGSSSVPAGTISGSQQITDLGFINQSQTSSMSVATASYVDPTFISASAAAAGFGTATLPSGVLSSSAQIAVEISGAFTSVSGGLADRITTLEGTSGGDVTALNLFTSSIQTQVDNLTAETSSYLTSADTASFVTISQTSSMSVLNAVTASYIDPTFISASAAAAGFGSGGGSVPAGTVSSSAQSVANLVGQDVVVNSITAQTYVISSSVSYITTSFSSGSTQFGDDLLDTHLFTGSVFVTGSVTAVSFEGNLNYNYLTNLPNLISSSAQIAALGAGLISSSAQIASDISGAFTSVSASFSSRITALEAGGGGGGTGIFALTGSFYSTTNNLQITGSLSVGSGSFKAFEVDTNGFVVLGDMDKDLNTAPVGTIVYSGSSFYLIS